MKTIGETESLRGASEGTREEEPGIEDPESLSGITRGNMMVVLAVGLLVLLGALGLLIAL
jgi:hypothetical protein